MSDKEYLAARLATGVKWGRAPTKTQWGADMVQATIALGKDETLHIYTSKEGVKAARKALKAAA